MSFAVLLLTLGVYVIRPGDWVPGLEIRWNLILNIVGSVAFLGLLVAGRAKVAADRTWAYLAVFYLLMLLSSVVHAQFADISIYTPQMLTNMLVFLLVCTAINSRRQLNMLAMFFLGLALFVAYQCHIQIETGANVAGVEPLVRRVETRLPDGELLVTSTLQALWVGVFHDPNDVGLLLVTLTPLAAAKALFAPGNTLARLTWGAIGIFLIYGIFLTNSRGTFLALLAGIGFFFILKYRSTKGLIMAGVGGFLFLTLGPSRMASLTSGDDSAMERVYIWIEALTAFYTSPVFGLGPLHWYDWHHMTTHNSYVLAFVENGFFAYVCWFALFLVPLYVITMIAFNEEDKRLQIEASTIGSCLAAVMMSIFFISRTYVLIPYFITAFTLTYCRIIHRDRYDQFLPNATLPRLTGVAAFSVIFIWITNILTTRLML